MIKGQLERQDKEHPFTHSSCPHRGQGILECAFSQKRSDSDIKENKARAAHKGRVCAKIRRYTDLLSVVVSKVLSKCNRSRRLLRDGQKIVPIHAFVLSDFVVVADTACIDHDPALLVGFRIE